MRILWLFLRNGWIFHRYSTEVAGLLEMRLDCVPPEPGTLEAGSLERTPLGVSEDTTADEEFPWVFLQPANAQTIAAERMSKIACFAFKLSTLLSFLIFAGFGRNYEPKQSGVEGPFLCAVSSSGNRACKKPPSPCRQSGRIPAPEQTACLKWQEPKESVQPAKYKEIPIAGICHPAGSRFACESEYALP